MCAAARTTLKRNFDKLISSFKICSKAVEKQTSTSISQDSRLTVTIHVAFYLTNSANTARLSTFHLPDRISWKAFAYSESGTTNNIYKTLVLFTSLHFRILLGNTGLWAGGQNGTAKEISTVVAAGAHTKRIIAEFFSLY